MGKRLLGAFASEDPQRFASALEQSDDVSETLAAIEGIPDDLKCDVVARLSPEAVERILKQLPDSSVIGWLEAASVESGRRLLAKESAKRSEQLILGISDRSKRRGLRRMAAFPAGSVGRLVQLGMISIDQDESIAEIEARLQGYIAMPEGPISVHRKDGRLIGVLDPLRFMQKRNSAETAADCCIPLKPVYADAPAHTLAPSDRWAGLGSLPVVDHEEKPIGFITRFAVENSLNQDRDQNPLADLVLILSERYLAVAAQLMSLFFDRRAKL